MDVKEKINKLLDNIHDRSLSNAEVDVIVRDILNTIESENTNKGIATPPKAGDLKLDAVQSCAVNLSERVVENLATNKTRDGIASSISPSISSPTQQSNTVAPLTTAVANAVADMQPLTSISKGCKIINIIRPELVISL